MISHLTPCILTTSAWTWVLTALIDTCFVERTFGAGPTFWPTCRRSANVIDQASADGHFVNFATLTVRTARRWMTRIRCRYWVGDYNWRCVCNIRMAVNVERTLETDIYFSVFDGRRRKDSQYNHRNNCSVVHDSQHGIRHLCRIHQGMGCDTCCWHMPSIWGSQSLVRILVYTRGMDHQYIRANRHKSQHRYVLCKWHSSRKVMDYMVPEQLVHGRLKLVKLELWTSKRNNALWAASQRS